MGDHLSAPRPGLTLGRAMSEPDSQAKACAQAGAQVDINVRVTTGGAAAAASASAQPNAQRPAESTQPNIAGFFSKRPAQKEPAPEMVGAPPAVFVIFIYSP